MNSLLRKVEREHYAQLLQQNKNNLKKSWTIIKNIVNKKEEKLCTGKFSVNDIIVTNPKNIVEKFNSFFVNIGPTLAKKITSTINPTSYIQKTVLDSIVFHDVNQTEVENIIISLKNSSPGIDNIHPRVLKYTYESYLIPLVHICNLSISQGFFPMK